MSQQQEPQQWAEWVENAGDSQTLIAQGQAWIKTDTVVEVKQ